MAAEIQPNGADILTDIKYQVEVVAPKQKLLSPQELQTFLETEGNVVWMKAGNLSEDLSEACVDGREGEAVVGTPGGDAAVFSDAIIAYGQAIGRHFNESEIEEMMHWYIGKFGSFYMHTDTHGLEHLMKSLDKDTQINQQFKTWQEVAEYIKNPPTEHQVKLLAHLVSPDNIGCGHLKQMVIDPAAYKQSRKVLQSTMRAFFNILWNGTEEEKGRMIYRVLEGEHEESAVVIIDTPDEVINDDTLIPLVKPKSGGKSMFITHPRVIEYAEEKVGIALGEASLFESHQSGEELGQQVASIMKARRGEGTRETVSRLAFGLPVYTATLTPQIS